DLGVLRVQVCLGGADIRPLAHKVCRQAERQPRRESKGSQLERRRQLFARKAPRQRRQQITLLRELPFERRQQQPRLGGGSLLRDDVGERDLPAVILTPQDVEQLGLNVDESARCGDLAAQRGFL